MFDETSCRPNLDRELAMLGPASSQREPTMWPDVLTKRAGHAARRRGMQTVSRRDATANSSPPHPRACESRIALPLVAPSELPKLARRRSTAEQAGARGDTVLAPRRRLRK